jgi:quinol monooxygenase YgiN
MQPKSTPASARLLRALVCRTRMVALLLAMVAVASSAQAQTNGGPVFAVTYLDVAANAVERGPTLLKTYRDASRGDAANIEFTILQEASRSNRFVIVEGWRDQAAFDTHQKSQPTATFLDALLTIRNSPPDRHVLQDFATGQTRPLPAGGTGAFVTVEHVDFQPQFGAAGDPLLKALAEATRKESGALRYDVYQQPRPRVNHYQVVAIWADQQAFDAHETAPHTLQFRSTSARPGRANLYDVRIYKPL